MEDFAPLVPEHVRMYVCGVTVYDDCHLGHARGALVFDVIRRYLEYKGYRVTYVRNITDIDDKIIQRSQKMGISWRELVEKYTEEYYRDMERLGVRQADIEPRATEHIKEIIQLVEELLGKGYAYVVGQDVYFSVRKFPGYGRLSRRSLDEMLAGARVEVDERKADPLDFALWKGAKPGEPSWESPWGPGRPGWHIECSAMSMHHLGPSFDIHGGGQDLIFPHHENEIAQSEACSGQPFVKYWLHNGMVQVNREKMSKSLGNFFTVKEILARYPAEVVRFFLLSTHYRSPIDFSDDRLEMAARGLERLKTAAEDAELALKHAPHMELIPEDEGPPVSPQLREYQAKFERCMDDDFNTAGALGALFELVKEMNVLRQRIIECQEPSESDLRLLRDSLQLLQRLGKVLGFELERVQLREWLGQLDVAEERRRAERLREIILEFCPPAEGAKEESAGNAAGLPQVEVEVNLGELGPEGLRQVVQGYIQYLVEVRARARKRKDWPLADGIRARLGEVGVVLEDQPHATIWKLKP